VGDQPKDKLNGQQEGASRMELQRVDLNVEKFSPIPTFVKVLTRNPRIAVPILLLGFLPSFAILTASIFLPEPSKNFWFFLNNSVSSFFSIVIVYFVGRDLLAMFRASSPGSVGFTPVLVLAAISLLVSLTATFASVLLKVALIVEAILPLLGTYLVFTLLNIAVTYIDSGTLSGTRLGNLISKSNQRIGDGFLIGFSSIVLVLIAVVPILIVSIFHVFLEFNRFYFYFFISLLIPPFSSIFFLSYIKKEYFTERKPMKLP
jgi:hypothetical protein